jgi:putative flippase GtrA
MDPGRRILALSTVREMYMRFRQLLHEGFKFLVVGGIGFVVTLGVANALHSTGKYKAITIATVVAAIVTYLGNRYWSFNKRQGQGTAREAVIFLVLNGVGLLIYYGCIGLIQDAGGLQGKGWYNFAIIVGTILGTLFRFWSYRKWVWTEVPDGAGASWPAVHGDQDPSLAMAQEPVGPPAEELPANSPSPVNQPWNGPKHSSTATRR